MLAECHSTATYCTHAGLVSAEEKVKGGSNCRARTIETEETSAHRIIDISVFEQDESEHE